jgi:energy-coupling factor transport system ATP-binding protein
METLNKLTVNNLNCNYDKRKVLNNISFSLGKGEVLSIIGPAGSGKTTLAYCLSGIIPNRVKGYVDGEILLNGENVLGREPYKLVGKIGLIMQDYETQIFGLTVEEDIMFGLENIGLEEKEIRKRLDWVLKSLGLENYRRKYTSQLSSGLKQKLVIASTISMYPEIVIMDDPLLNLDWSGIKNLENIIIDLKKQGISFIILTKHIKGLERAIDKIIMLNGNTVMHEGELSFINKKDTMPNNYEKSVPLIEVDNVWFKYPDGDLVIKGVSLNVYGGDVLAIMGPNGSGKTTLIKLMSGLLKPTKGHVKVIGRSTRNHGAAKLAKYVTIVFQNPEKHITFETVWDEVAFGCKNLKLPLSYAENALKCFQLFERIYDPPYELSMSEKIKLNIASAFALDPNVLILDEPVTIHDHNSLGIIKTVIEKMRSIDRAVIIVTHDSDLAFSLCNRVVIINDGIIIADNTPQSIFSNHEILRKVELKQPEVPTHEIKLGGAHSEQVFGSEN